MKMKRLITEVVLVLVLIGGLAYAPTFGGSGEFGKLKLTFQKLKWNIFPKTSGGIDVGSTSKKIGAVHVIDLYADHIAGDTIVETVTSGTHITNSGTAKNPILDLDADISADTIVERTPGAGVIIEEVRLEDGEVQAGAWKATEIADEYGGTGQTTYAKGDLLHAILADALARLAIGTDNQILVVATDLPAWETASSDLLSDVASIGMLDEAETMLAKWDFSSYQMTDADVEDTMTVIAAADIEMGGTYQVVGLQAPAASGEAIRQTAKIDETKLESLYDNRVDTYTSPLGKSSQTVAMTNVDNSATDGYLTWEQFAILEDKYTQAEDNALLAEKLAIVDTDIFALADGSRNITGLQKFEAGFNLNPLAVEDSPINPLDGDFWFDSSPADSGPNVYFDAQWQRIRTDKDKTGALMYISTAGTVTVDTGLEYQKVSGGSIAYTGTHLNRFSHTAGTLTYVGLRNMHFMITVNASLESGETAQDVHIRIAKNGTAIAGTNMETTFTAINTHTSSGTSWCDELSTGDTIIVSVTSDTTADDVIFNNMIVNVMQH